MHVVYKTALSEQTSDVQDLGQIHVQTVLLESILMTFWIVLDLFCVTDVF